MPSYINVILMTVLICPAAVNVYAEPLSDKAFERIVDQLGADEYKLREEAERLLAKLARREPEAMRAGLNERLLHESDPEVQFRIKHVLAIISRIVPVEKVPFTKETLAAKHWGIVGDAPKHARFQLERGLLEIDSLEKVEEGMGFVHQFDGREPEDDPLKFGRRPAPDPERLVLDAEIKMLKERLIRNGLAGMHLNVEDHRASAGLMILADGIFLYRHKHLHKMDTTDRWHHFRFVIDGNLQQVFVDDMEKPIFELERPKQAGRQWATFGDGTAGAGVHAQIRNVTFARYDLKPD